MEYASIVVKTKQVGNSIAVFIPAEVCKTLDIKPNSELVASIRKKNDKRGLLELFGATNGKLGPWNEDEDRLDVRD